MNIPQNNPTWSYKIDNLPLRLSNDDDDNRCA